jgi:GNAT superfamily N-acetyltransferase
MSVLVSGLYYVPDSEYGASRPGSVAPMPEVTSRLARIPDDGDFLRSLYASTRRAELQALGWSEAAQDTFIQMQFDAQSHHYRESFPNARHSVICVDGERAGRLIVSRSETEMAIVDITLLPEFRRCGVGGGLVRALLEEADAHGLRVTLHVLRGSDARRFWERAGFVALDNDDLIYVAMERVCAALPT